jgi:hypothetical protein
MSSREESGGGLNGFLIGGAVGAVLGAVVGPTVRERLRRSKETPVSTELGGAVKSAIAQPGADSPVRDRVMSRSSPAAAPGDLEAAAAILVSDIQMRHLPFGTILDPVFAPGTDEIVSYTRAADSAIWTGHYLAAESFHFGATRSDEARENVKRALAGIRSLVDVTGTNLLARAIVPVDSPYAAAITNEEAHHGIFRAQLGDREFFWIGNTSRDQYSGVFFGLAAAFEMVDDPDVRSTVGELVTRLLDFLLEHHWVVVMPNGDISTVFIGRPDQQLALLQIGREVNPDRFDSVYRDLSGRLAPLVIVPIAYEVLDDHNSYFKFNLDTINLFSLIRLERNSRLQRVYEFAYRVLRRTTDDHGNAHFNMIDRVLAGPDERRDPETRALLEAWLLRPRRDDFVDLRGTYESCGQPDRACVVIPVEQRVRTDFLWQRSPFLLFGGGEGTIEGAGIDLLLPYWMARVYGVL